jgi:hypothetical protein
MAWSEIRAALISRLSSLSSPSRPNSAVPEMATLYEGLKIFLEFAFAGLAEFRRLFVAHRDLRARFCSVMVW